MSSLISILSAIMDLLFDLVFNLGLDFVFDCVLGLAFDLIWDVRLMVLKNPEYSKCTRCLYCYYTYILDLHMTPSGVMLHVCDCCRESTSEVNRIIKH